MKKVLLFVGLMIMTRILTASAEVDPNFYIYLCFGQSNMEGNARPEDQDMMGVDERFQMLACTDFESPVRKKGEWYTAIPPIVRSYTGLGMADYFGRTMVANLPQNVKVGVVDVAVAGVSIEGFMPNEVTAYAASIGYQWMKDIFAAYDNDPYKRLVDMAKIAQKKGVIKGILLHQGESNCGQEDWPQKVKKIYDSLIKDLGLNAADIPLFVGETVRSELGGSCGGHNSVVAKVPGVIPNSYVISSANCPQKGDGLHFTAQGYRIMGQRYAKAALQLMNIHADVLEPEVAQSAEFETAFEAVKNMKVGWNLWNTLESPGAEYDPTNYRSWETAWGNPVTKPELMKMMRKAGYNAIRLPVTWYPYTDEKGNVDSRWMARVHEVVDYVIDQGMYCILNVHHDTGGIDGESHTWIIADEDNYEQKHERFENIWRQIAEEFKDYDEHLLFEGYNEMVDIYNSWGDAFSWAVLLGIEPEYNEDKEQSIYKAVNKYAQSFVDVVRSTGGNNKMRNLIVNTYSGSDGKKPIKNLKVPDDKVAGHIAIQVHFYPEINEETANVITQSVSRFKAAIEEKNAPIIIGEWLMGEDTDDALRLSRYFMEQIRDYPIAPFIFGSCQGFYRSMPAFDHPEHVKEMMKGYYGDGYEPQLLTADDYDTPYIASFEEYDSELGLLTETSLDDLIGYRIDLAETPEEGKLEIIAIGEKGSQFQEVQSKSTTITFDKSLLGDKLTFLYMLSKHSGLYTVKVNSSVAIFRSKPYEKKIFGWNNNKCDVKYLFIRKQFVHNVAYNERWAELNIFYDDVPLKLKNYKGIRLELAEPLADAQVKVYGDGGQKEDYLPLTGVSTTISFNKEIFSSEINRVTLQNTQDGKSQAKVISAWLIRQDGTEEYSDLSLFHGCKITDITKYEGNSDAKDQYLVNPSFDHDLSGWTNTNGTARWKENTWEVLSNYCEFEWTGGPIANQEVVQFPTLPTGNYRLSFDCASDTNSKGLYLVAGSNTKELLGADGINSFSLDFSVAEESKIKIGFKVENTTATWVNFDNFKLEKISSTAIYSIKADDSHHAIIYNLAGQRLSKPQKGINIIDGKKVVVK